MNYADVKSKIEGLTVQSLDGENIILESLWRNRRLVLAFLRHFG